MDTLIKAQSPTRNTAPLHPKIVKFLYNFFD